jgi:glycosyltransferase involved in cell wall biosynthesis
VVTNVWPHPGEPRYGIFAKRQVDSVTAAVVPCDVWFVRGFESPLAYAVAALRLLRESLRRRPRYRLVHGHGGETLIPCLAYLRGARLVSFCGDDLLGTPGPDGRISRRSRAKSALLRTLARLTTATVTKSAQMAATLPEPVRRRNTVLPNGVDRGFFRPLDRSEARAGLGWPADERVALFVGDPELPRKRHGLAAAACEEAARRGVPLRLHVAHTTPPDSMPAIMSAADCLLVTSATEGSPNAVKEALMCDLPIVATAVGDVPELLDGVTPSYVVDEAEPSELADALVACMRNGGRSDGRERSEWLDDRRIAERLIRLYDSIAPR